MNYGFWGFFDFLMEGFIDIIPIVTKQHCTPGQFVKRLEDGDNLCEKLSKVIFIAGSWIDKETTDPKERRKVAFPVSTIVLGQLTRTLM